VFGQGLGGRQTERAPERRVDRAQALGLVVREGAEIAQDADRVLDHGLGPAQVRALGLAAVSRLRREPGQGPARGELAEVRQRAAGGQPVAEGHLGLQALDGAVRGLGQGAG
jgi:hypothetical protein